MVGSPIQQSQGIEPAPPDAVAPPPRHPRFPLLDGLRAVAVLCVVVVHSWVASGAPSSAISGLVAHLNLGVTIFFLLSGFLLYRPFIAHRAGGPPPPELHDYGRRRLLRILPAYWLVVTVVLLIPELKVASDGPLSMYALTFTVDGANRYVCDGCALGQTWSLAIEATFYLCLPLLVLATTRVATRWRRSWPANELGLLALLALLGILLQFVVYDGSSPGLIGGTAIGYAYWFALGMAVAAASACIDAGAARLAVASVRLHPGLFWLAALALFAGTCAWLPANPFLTEVDEKLVAFLSFGLVSLLLLLPAVFDAGFGAPNRILGHPLVAWLGLISYGVFLWHVPVIEAARAWGPDLAFVPMLVTAVAITIPIAAASYYLLERPLLRYKYRAPRLPAPRHRGGPPVAEAGATSAAGPTLAGGADG